MVDTGAGSHLFTKDFDPCAQSSLPSSKHHLITVTGEPSEMGERKKSLIEAEASSGNQCKFTMDYDESEKMNFSVLSAGNPADAGVWTIIGPNIQCMVRSNETQHIKKFPKNVDTIPLVKKRGVFWLPTSLQSAGGPASRAGGTAGVLGAVKAAAKTVPARLIEEERQEAPGPEGQPLVSSRSRDQDPNPPEVERGDVEVEISEEGRKPRAKKISEHVSHEEFHTRMLTHSNAFMV